ncbi:hypothetical protein EVAR_55124_1 [Eumeta japonica]|uniref:Uncharacterized protein n=1 Tax=Eumeta variegata TaxID=151549 RepID=A0A4C1Y8S3_EUMVA|nr:hypothetical protein EVAR_55124_1 [Eumeta japonica]
MECSIAYLPATSSDLENRSCIFFLRRCPNAETLSRHESPDCGAKRGDYACAVTPIQPMPPRGELLN